MSEENEQNRLPSTGRRKDDKEGLAKLINTVMKYQWIWSLIVLLVIALGFQFETPAKKFDRIEEQIGASNQQRTEDLAVVKVRVDTLHQDVTDIKDLLRIIAIDVCLRRANEPFARDRLRCDAIIRTGR